MCSKKVAVIKECPALRKKFPYGLVRGYCAVKEYALLKEITLGLQVSFFFF